MEGLLQEFIAPCVRGRCTVFDFDGLPAKKFRVLRCFVVFPFFALFSDLVAQDGSTWANIGLKMGQHSLQDGSTWPQDRAT